jgi:hypothetical protein
VSKYLIVLAFAIFAAACGHESSVIESLAVTSGQTAAAAAPPPPREPQPEGTPLPAPPPSPSTLVLQGDLEVDNPSPDVVVEPLAAADGREQRLRIELRHREGGSSQPDAVVVFLNVPARPGTYPLHSPTDPMVAGRVYAFVTTRGEAVGSMKDFNSSVGGTLTLRPVDAGLAGSFSLTAMEPPPPPPPSPQPGQPPPRPVVGTVPPEPPAQVDVEGTVLVPLPRAPIVGDGAGQSQPRQLS